MIASSPQDAQHVHAFHDVRAQCDVLAQDARRLHVAAHVPGCIRADLPGHVVDGSDEPRAVELLG